MEAVKHASHVFFNSFQDFLLLEEKQASKDQVKEITGNEDKGNVHLTLEKVSAR